MRLVDRLYPEYRNLRYPARLVERAARGRIDQPFVSHVFQEALQVDLHLAGEAERPGDLALSGRLVGRGDEIEDLLAAAKP